jgi:ferric iron reductase protein FhuF
MVSQLRPATGEQVSAALAGAGELGLFFGFADLAGGAAGWRPAIALYAPGPSPLDDLVASARASLGGCERRVAASLLYQGYAARLLSPQLGCLATHGCVPALPADGLCWRQPGTQLIELGAVEASTSGPAGVEGPADALLGEILRQSFDEHLGPLSAALRSRVKLPASLLRDNAASALVGALRLLDQVLEHQPDRRLRPGWRTLARLALADPRVRGSGMISDSEPAFTRRSCCLYYRVDGGGTCGDCPLGPVALAGPAR